MINRDNTTLQRNCLKKYLKVAKENKMIPILYKADNILKNSNLREGIFRVFLAYERLFPNAQPEEILRYFNDLRNKIKNISLKESLTKSYYNI